MLKSMLFPWAKRTHLTQIHRRYEIKASAYFQHFFKAVKPSCMQYSFSNFQFKLNENSRVNTDWDKNSKLDTEVMLQSLFR
jgi:hypothetical protein